MLFDVFPLGDLLLRNRVVMAPMTRSRAGQPGDVPTALTAEYYAQRSGAGLIISEASPVSPAGHGYLWTPGIHSAEQVAGWKQVADAVHANSGRIFLQLWHVGRISHTSLQPDGAAPLSSTARRADAQAFGYDEQGNPAYLPCSAPRAATGAEIAAVVNDFRRATENAMAAGCDGVEVHGANGYLLDQFLNGALNDRNDDYGGSIANRARLLLEVIDAAVAVAGAGRVGVRLSPHGSFNDMPADPDADAMTLYLAEQLGSRGLAYVHFVDPVFSGYADGARLLRQARTTAGIPIIACGDMDRSKAETYLREELADLIAFGRPFIANPDLVVRLHMSAPLNAVDEATIYGGDAHGYTDYPALR